MKEATGRDHENGYAEEEEEDSRPCCGSCSCCDQDELRRLALVRCSLRQSRRS